jgi:ribosomal protein S13
MTARWAQALAPGQAERLAAVTDDPRQFVREVVENALRAAERYREIECEIKRGMETLRYYGMRHD